jgi:hypothetical protein
VKADNKLNQRGSSTTKIYRRNLKILKIEKNCEFGDFQLPEVRGKILSKSESKNGQIHSCMWFFIVWPKIK